MPAWKSPKVVVTVKAVGAWSEEDAEALAEELDELLTENYDNTLTFHVEVK